MPLIGDVTAGGLTKLAGGVASAPLAPLRAFVGGGTIPRVAANLSLNGILYGLLYGAGEGDTLEERATNAGFGGFIGGLGGAAFPVIASGAGSTLTALARPFLNRRPAPLRQFNRKAVNKVARTFEDSGLAEPGAFTRRAQELGPQGTIADATPATQIQGAALARFPGRGQAEILDTLNTRNAGAGQRLNDAVTDVLGPPENLVQLERRVTEAAQRAASPLYREFYETRIRPTEALNRLLDRAQESGAYRTAERLMRIEGVDPDIPQNSGQFLDLIKRAVDDMAKASEPGSNKQRIFGNLAREIRDEVDSILSPRDPSSSVWAQARQFSGEGRSFKEALADGGKVFGTAVHPDQLADDLARATPIERAGIQAGARAQLLNKAGNAATQQGPNDAGASLRALGSNFARDKVRLLRENPVATNLQRPPGGNQTRPDADELFRRFQAEADFRATDALAQRNSVTSTMQAAQKEFPLPTDDLKPIIAGITPYQDVKLGVTKILDYFLQGAINEGRRNVARDASRMLFAQGASRDQIAAALREYVGSRNLSASQRARVIEYMRTIGRGAQPVTTGAAIESFGQP